MAKCRLCGKRPGKRFCPAIQDEICAVCCARDRLLEIACTDTCSYLIAGRESSGEKSATIVRKWRSGSGRIANKTFGGPELTAIVCIEAAIVEARRSRLKGIRDRDILDALENASRNLRTADSGLIYEHKVASAEVQELSQLIRTGLDDLDKMPPGSPRPSTANELDAIEVLSEIVQAHIEHGDDDKSYLRSIAIRVPWSERKGEPQSQGLLIK